MTLLILTGATLTFTGSICSLAILLWRCACQWWGEALNGIAAEMR